MPAVTEPAALSSTRAQRPNRRQPRPQRYGVLSFFLWSHSDSPGRRLWCYSNGSTLGWATGEAWQNREGAGRQESKIEREKSTSLSTILSAGAHITSSPCCPERRQLPGWARRACSVLTAAPAGSKLVIRMHNAWPRRTLPIMVCRRGQTKRRDALFLLRVRWVGAHGEGNPSCPTPTTTRPIEADATLLCWQSRGEIDVFGAFSVLLPSPNSSATGV